jgi:hypothetical protein
MKEHGTRVPFFRHAHLYFTLAFVVTMAGFWPSFFNRLGKTDASHMIHGISATLWMIVPIVQAWLVNHREFEWHRRVGRLVFLHAPILVVSGLRMVQIMLLKDQGISRTLRIKFTFLDLSALFLFIVVLSLALKSIYRRDVKAHAQYMSCTVLIVLEPAVERFLLHWVPGIGSFDVALNVTLLIMAVIVAALISIEWRSDRIHAAYLMTFAFFMAVFFLLEPVSSSATFQSFAHWFATF